MKTSTIILVSFFIVVFLTPLFIALALTSKIKNGEYSLKKNNENPFQRNYPTGDFSVLVVKGQSPAFKCNIHYGDSSFLTYQKFGNDSVKFERVADTLTIYYTSADNKANHREYEFNVDIHVKDIAMIKGENASIIIVADTSLHLKPLRIELKDTAELKFQSSPFSNREMHADGTNNAANTSSARFNELSITSSASEVFFENFVHVNNLTLEIRNQSNLHLSKAFRPVTLTGSVSDDSEIHGAWTNIKKFKSFVGNSQ